MEAFGIFEGGGVKGLAHIGALAASEQRGVNFIGVAGTSAGAIVAALVSVGYTANTLYDPRTTTGRGIFDIDYLSFFEREDWESLKRLVADARKKFGKGTVSRINPLRMGTLSFRLIALYIRHSRILKNLTGERGVFDTHRFTEWLEEHLAVRLRSHPVWGAEVTAGCKVLFKHIDMPLKIIATDLTNQTIKVFSQEEDGDQSVAEAVAASVSIPFLFKPLRFDRYLQGQELVDGGLLSNFPAWVFDKERRDVSPLTQTFGFKFVGTTDEKAHSYTGLLEFAKNVALTTLTGSDHLQSRQIENLLVIPLKVPAKTTQFDLEDNDREDLYERGKHCAKDAFEQVIGWISQEDMEIPLSVVDSTMLQAIGKPNISLRICVMLPTGVYKDRLKVIYCHNFAPSDADDRLELPTGVGVAGRCWDIKDVVIGDMGNARIDYEDKWKMTKYQQALVRPHLKSCLCLPIFKNVTSVLEQSRGQGTLIGVLSVDSDHDLIEDFGRDVSTNTIVAAALKCSKLISKVLS